jgi:hypothetical protein
VTASLIVQPEAEADLGEAFHWYEGHRVGLGHEFLEEVSHTLARIAEQPLRYPVIIVKPGVHSCDASHMPPSTRQEPIACSCWRSCISGVTRVSAKLAHATSKRSEGIREPHGCHC